MQMKMHRPTLMLIIILPFQSSHSLVVAYVTHGLKTRRLSLPKYLDRGPNRREWFSSCNSSILLVLCNRTVDDDNSEDNNNDDNNHNNHSIEFDRNVYRIEELLFKNKLVTDNLNI